MRGDGDEVGGEREIVQAWRRGGEAGLWRLFQRVEKSDRVEGGERERASEGSTS